MGGHYLLPGISVLAPKSVAKNLFLFAALTAAACTNLITTKTAFAVSGTQSAGGGAIGPAHVTFGAPFGNTVGFVSLGAAGTGTGTFVPSSTPGQFKFLTAAHNVDGNSDGVLDIANLTVFFGAAPGSALFVGQDGQNATFQVNATAAQIAVHPQWSTSNGSATYDLAVVTFNLNDIIAVNGGAVPVVSPVYVNNPLNMQAVVAGHGLQGDGTVVLLDPVPLANEVDGILKGGTNIIDFVGVPGNIVPPTVSPASGIVVLVDFDDNLNPGVSSFNGVNANPALEAGTAPGDSGSAILVDSDGDGNFEVAGVLNGGDNPFGGASQFGDISQFAPIFTPANQAFLVQQGVFLGLSASGLLVAGNWSIVDLAAINQLIGVSNFLAQFAAESITEFKHTADDHVGNVVSRRYRAANGLSLLDNGCPVFGAVNGNGAPTEETRCKRFEVYFEGRYQAISEDGPAGVNPETDQLIGHLGIEALLTPHILGGLAGGVGTSADDDEMDKYFGTVYVIGQVRNVTASAAYSAAHHSISADRTPGPWEFSADGFTHSFDAGVSALFETRYVDLTPHINARYTTGELRDVSITNAGMRTPIADQDIEQSQVEVGLRGSRRFTNTWGAIIPYIGAAYVWREDHSDSAVNVTQSIRPFFLLASVGGQLAILNLPNTVSSTGSASSDADTHFAEVSLGLEARANNGVGMSFGLSTAFDAEEFRGASGRVGFGIPF